MAALEMRGVVKRYRAGIPGCSADVEALRGVDLRVELEEVVGVAGAPGSGKTTLLLVAAGALRRDGGSIAWFGRLGGRTARPAGIAYVSDVASHYGFLTSREVLEHSAGLTGLPTGERARSVEEELARSGLARIADVRVGALSPGAARRLGIAQALVGAPRLLIVDEPFAGLDHLAQAAVAERLRLASREGTTVLVASRDTRALAAAAGRVVVMSMGRLQGDLDPRRFTRDMPVGPPAGGVHPVDGLVTRVAEPPRTP